MRLILLHGWTMAGDVFDPLIAALPGYDCLAPDLPGHGSEGYAPTIAGGAEMLRDLLRGDRPSVVVGWSMGALVAWEHVARHGTAGLAGLVSIDMSPRPMPDWRCGMPGLDPASARAPGFEADWPAAAQAMARAMFARRDGAPALDRAQAAARIAARDPAAMMPFWQQMLDCDHRPVVATLRVPCLAIHGAESRVYPPLTAHWIAGTAPQGMAVVIPEAGHAPILEQPDATAAAITGFLRGLA